MPNHGKKGGRKSGSLRRVGDGDVTLADYANSKLTFGKGRLGKGKTSLNIAREVKQLNIEDKAWDEKLEDFEGDFDFIKEENEDGEEVYIMRKTPRRKKTLSESIAEKRRGEGNSYPLDIWFLISEYIRPEDVGKFSALCKDAWSVVSTPAFWLGLYKRHYKNLAALPSRLQPECIVRHHSLKACVVRALYHMYPPLNNRLDQGSMSAPYDLKNRQCISMWQEKHSNKWRLSFKLRRKDVQSNSSGERQKLEDILGDIFANSEDGCTILQVVSAERTVPPVVMGLTLHSIAMSLDTSMAHMQTTLVFGTGRICNGKLDATGTVTFSLKAVLQVSVLDWWHPRYPHSPSTIILPLSDS